MVTETNDNALIVAEQSQMTASDSFQNWMDKSRFEHIQRVAKIFSESQLVPAHFRGKIADCIIGIQMAFRLNVDPLMLLQKTYIVHGKPGIEAQMAIALVNARGPFKGPIQWRFSGTEGKDDWTATAYATHAVTDEVCEAECSMSLAKAEGWYAKEGSKWKTMPKMMLRYRSATFLARLYAPECLMGMSTQDEIYDYQEPIIAHAEVIKSVSPASLSLPGVTKPAETKPPEPQPAEDFMGEKDEPGL